MSSSGREDVLTTAAARATYAPALYPQAATRSVILDTDWWTDVDDVLGVRIACHAERLGMVNLKAVTIDTKLAKGPGSVGSVLAAEGRVDVSIGAHPSYVPSGSPPYQTNLFDKWTHPDTAFWANTPAALTVLRTQLAAAANNSVDIVAMGYCTNLSDLLQSPADGISSLTGLQLVTQKVRWLWLAAGRWPNGSENNFNRDATAKAAGAYVVANWPTPITFLGLVAGLPRSGDNLSGLTTTDPASAALADYGTANGSATATIGRNSWGAQVMWLAAMGDATAAGYSTVQGTATVNASTGANTFTPGAGSHYYVTRNQHPSWYAKDLNSRLTSGSRVAAAVAPRAVVVRTPVTTGALAANLVLHLHADDIDSSITDGNPVSFLDDRMRQHALQSVSSTSRPTATTAGGLRALHFTGTQWMNTDMIEWLDAVTIYAKVRWTTLPTTGQNPVVCAVGGTGSAPADDRAIWVRGNAAAQAEGVAWPWGVGGSANIATGPSLVVNTWHIITVRITPTSVQTSLDGTSTAAVTTPSQNLVIRPLTVGSKLSDTASDPLTADVRQFRAYSVTHDDATVTAVVADMAS